MGQLAGSIPGAATMSPMAAAAPQAVNSPPIQIPAASANPTTGFNYSNNGTSFGFGGQPNSAGGGTLASALQNSLAGATTPQVGALTGYLPPGGFPVNTPTIAPQPYPTQVSPLQPPNYPINTSGYPVPLNGSGVRAYAPSAGLSSVSSAIPALSFRSF